MIKITLKDGSVKEYNKGTTIKEVAGSISAGLLRVAVAGTVNGKVKDLLHKLEEDCDLSIVTFEDDGGKYAYRHTSSHVTAQAVKRIYPNAKLAIGPAIDNGFYYDFDIDKPFALEDLEKIEKEIAAIIKEDLVLERFTLPRAEAIKLMEEKRRDV